MKHEAEEELLKTLNGQLSELPSVAKTMVQQYQMSAIVLSVLCGVLFIAAVAGTIWLLVFFHKHINDADDLLLATATSATIGGGLSIGLLLSLCQNLVHACAPIASIVSDILGN